MEKLVRKKPSAEVSNLTKQLPRVLHIVQALRGGGAEALVRELVPRLRQRGIDARVLCAYGASGLTDVEAPDWTGVMYCQPRAGVPRLRYLERMWRLLREIEPTVVHTHTHVGAVWGRTAAVLARVPQIVHTEHGSDNETVSAIEAVALGALSYRTDATVTFSERSAALARTRGPLRKLHIIPNGIRVRPPPTESDRHTARLELRFARDLIAIGLIANLFPHKNPTLAIDAIARLPDRTRAFVQLAIFGDGPMREDLVAYAKALGIEASVQFYGFRSDLVRLLPGLDLVVTTSPREMMPISLLESMNAGLPIIGVPHAGTLDLVVDRETGIIVRSWDPQGFSEAIEWAVGQPQWRARAGNEAYTRLKKEFDIETVADRHAALYRSLTG